MPMEVYQKARGYPFRLHCARYSSTSVTHGTTSKLGTMSEKCLWVGFWKHHCRGHTYVKKMGTDNNMPLRYSGQTVTFMKDEGIALVHIQVGGVGGNGDASGIERATRVGIIGKDIDGHRGII